MMMERRSFRLDEEREAVERLVQEEHARGIRRKSSAYLPLSVDAENQLRMAKGAIQTIYEIHQRYELRRRIENAAFAIALMGIVLVCIDNQDKTSRSAKLYLRIVNVVLTCVLLVLVVARFVVERTILVKRNVVPAHVSIIHMPVQVFTCLMELLVCAICIPPGVSGSFTVWEWKFYSDPGKTACPAPYVVDEGSCYFVYSYPYEVLGLFCMFRLYMLPRLLRNISDFTNYRTSYLGTLHHVDTFSSLFAVKCFLRSHPFKFLLVSFAGSLLLTALTLSIVEAPINPTLAPFWNSMWLVAMTMATIGYGDVTAVTITGQLILTFGGMLVGILLLGGLGAAIFGFLMLDEPDRRFIHSLKRQQYNRQLKIVCARTIQAAWKRYQGVAKNSQKVHEYLHECTAEQRALRKESVGDYLCASTELSRCQQQLLLSLRQEHTATMKRFHQIEARVDVLMLAATDAVIASNA